MVITSFPIASVPIFEISLNKPLIKSYIKISYDKIFDYKGNLIY